MNTTKTEAWKVEKFERAPEGCTANLMGFRVVDDEGTEICEIFAKPTPVRVDYGTANLIAAAPELKATLEEAIFAMACRSNPKLYPAGMLVKNIKCDCCTCEIIKRAKVALAGTR